MRRRLATIARVRGHKRERRQLASDLQKWLALGTQRAGLAEAAEQRGQSWEAQARAQGLAIDHESVAVHAECGSYIASHHLRRGNTPW